jgi:hypothetical protein
MPPPTRAEHFSNTQKPPELLPAVRIHTEYGDKPGPSRAFANDQPARPECAEKVRPSASYIASNIAISASFKAERYALSQRRCARAERGQNEPRKPNVQRLKRYRFELRRRLSKPATQKHHHMPSCGATPDAAHTASRTVVTRPIWQLDINPKRATNKGPNACRTTGCPTHRDFVPFYQMLRPTA